MNIIKEKYFRHSEGQPVRIRPVFLDFHKLSALEDCQYPEHTHRNYELIVVDKGPYRCLLNNDLLEVPNGGFLMIKPNDTHSDHFFLGQTHHVLHFSLVHEALSSESDINLFADNTTPQQQIGIIAQSQTNNFFNQLEMELKRGDSFSTYIQDSMLETYFWQILRNVDIEVLSPKFRIISQQMDFQRRMLSIFSNHESQTLSVEEMAQLMEVSSRKLNYLCKEHLNQTPSQAFTRFKIDRACEKLLRTDLTIQQISYQLGFENPFHFSKVFKNLMDYSPKAYRKKSTGSFE